MHHQPWNDNQPAKTRGVAILGSTGSIGKSALAVIGRQRDHFRVVALTARSNEAALGRQVAQWQPAYSALVSKTGPEALIEAATRPDVDIVLNAVVGSAGLDATLAALRAGKRVALANKETLVMAGDLVRAAACGGGGELVPVDSEHSAVLQCLQGRETGLARVILTASGGPFREWEPDRIRAATVQEALNHPTWSMGNKVTVDSATLANKALELIEAHHFFGIGYDTLDVVVHPQSIVHALVEYCDGSVIAQIAFPSMELPILYALTYPARLPDQGVRRFDPVQAGVLTFEPVRSDVFRAYSAGLSAGRAGGTAPAVFNAANETAVAAFLDGRVPFGRISDTIERVLDEHDPAPAGDLDTVRAADRWSRVRATEVLK
ncbi:MAG TPA: 1-deoxy-D-xylulose-5-phosphate reductoisomerase [Gemmatimonadales bacterium]|nr:1-deoxy-D-xylulose-5-phosphate reductoisomerase [Gemmatimonadales bacterium]